jgi:hypothetical protein
MKPESVENINKYIRCDDIYKHTNPTTLQPYSPINTCLTTKKRNLFILLYNLHNLITAYCPDAKAISAIHLIVNCAMNLS